MSKLEVTRESVLAAAETCREAKEVLKAMFPEAFKPEYHNFGTSTQITQISSPVYIGFGHAQCSEHKHKVSIVDKGWDVEVVPGYYAGRTGLFFKKR